MSIIAFPVEQKTCEKRCALLPVNVKAYTLLGATVLVQAGLGEHLHIQDKEYLDAGAEIVNDRKELLSRATIVLSLHKLTIDDVSFLDQGCMLVSYLVNERLFTTTNATSAATALAAKMAAQLMSEYPELWPETIRALMVHSASWTPAMAKMFFPERGNPNKSQIANLVRHCGFGQPNLDQALCSVDNSLTMICEETLHPFWSEKGKGTKLRDMNLHRLAWPIDELEELGETEVEMRVTLSYFIEPNPSARGVTSRYRYESHGLRFDVKRPIEEVDDFRARINAAARNEEERTRIKGDDDHWLLGKQNRHRGSLHSDIWKGKAVELASRGVIAVYPALGWWKTRHALERYDQLARY